MQTNNKAMSCSACICKVPPQISNKSCTSACSVPVNIHITAWGTDTKISSQFSAIASCCLHFLTASDKSYSGELEMGLHTPTSEYSDWLTTGHRPQLAQTTPGRRQGRENEH